MSISLEDKLKQIWNSKSDVLKQWSQLSFYEKLEFSAMVEREEFDSLCMNLWFQDAFGSEYARAIRNRPNSDAQMKGDK